MFEFAKKFGVNEKLTFRLYPELAAESYTLLIKKVKDNLVAAVISNNDKNSVDLKINDEIYLFSEAGGKKWVTKTLLMQRHSYPLVILSVAGEPWPQKPPHEEWTPVKSDDAWSPELESPPDLVVTDNAGPPAADRGENGDDLESMPSITIRELNSEPERPAGQDGMRPGAEDMESMPDIDTSELEAEFNADIEDTLEKGRVSFAVSNYMDDETAASEPLAAASPEEPEEEDDLSGMTIEKDSGLVIGNFDDDEAAAEPAARGLQAPEPMEIDIGEPEAEPEARDDDNSLYIPESGSGFLAAPEVFHDFFTAYLTPAGAVEPEPVGLDPDVSPGVKQALGVLMERIERLEGALSSIGAHPVDVSSATASPPASGRIAVVLAGLTEEGFKAAMEEAPVSGERFIVDIERQWRPPLFLKATVVAMSSFSVNNITLARFSFEGLDEAGRMAVRAYLDGRAGYFRSLAEMVKD